MITKVIIPSAMSWVFAGLKISVPYALIGAVLGEMIAANRGLGYLVQFSGSQFDSGRRVRGAVRDRAARGCA